MSDFKWEDILNPSKVEESLDGLAVDPRNGEPIKDADTKRKELEALLNKVPMAKDADATPEDVVAPPAAFAPKVELPHNEHEVKLTPCPAERPKFENPPIKLDWDDEAPAAPAAKEPEGFVEPVIFEAQPKVAAAPPVQEEAPAAPPVMEEVSNPFETPAAPPVMEEGSNPFEAVLAPPVMEEPAEEAPVAEEPAIVFETPSAPPVMEEPPVEVPKAEETVIFMSPPVIEEETAPAKIDMASFGIEMPKQPEKVEEATSPFTSSKAPEPPIIAAEEEEEDGISWDKPDFSGLPTSGQDTKSPFGAKVGRTKADSPMKEAAAASKSPVDPVLLMKAPEKSRMEGIEKEEAVPFHIVSNEAPFVHDYHIDELLRQAVEQRASDVHLTVGLPPMVRVDGELKPLNFQPLRPADSRRLVYDTLTADQLEKFERTHELDFGYMVKGLSRFRFNVYMQRGSVAGALRLIPNRIPSFETLGLPSIIKDLSKRSSGLILVTGPTGSGKSTTIATMIDDINETRNEHIMTIEDPIEYLHMHKKSMVNQREMHADTYSFHDSLRAVLREDPDIILVGELRDLETIEAALTLAETGHLVFGTLHTRNAPATIDRIIDVFSADQQSQIRVLLGNTLEAVISQQLLTRQGGGRSAALEIMIGTPAIKNLIREGKTHQMYSIIETSKNIGMLTMDHSLAELYRSGKCSYDDCLSSSVDKETFVRLAKGAA